MSLKELREKRGLTQQEAADLFGIKYRTYQNYENGTTSPRMDTAAQFARFFNCTIGDLFDLEEGSPLELQDDERELLGLYATMNDPAQVCLLAMARKMADVFPR